MTLSKSPTATVFLNIITGLAGELSSSCPSAQDELTRVMTKLNQLTRNPARNPLAGRRISLDETDEYLDEYNDIEIEPIDDSITPKKEKKQAKKEKKRLKKLG